MTELDPIFKQALLNAVTHVLKLSGPLPAREVIEAKVTYLMKGLIQGPTRTGAEWHNTWTQLINHFWSNGANFSQAQALAYDHFGKTILDTCIEVASGKWDDEIHSLETLETCIRNTISNITQE